MCHGPLPHVHKDPGWSRCPIFFHMNWLYFMWNIHVFRYLALFVWWAPSLYLVVYNFPLAFPPFFLMQIEIAPPCSIFTCCPSMSYPPSWSPTPFPTLKTLKSESSMLKLKHQSHPSGLHGDPTSTSQSLQPTHMSWNSSSVLPAMPFAWPVFLSCFMSLLLWWSTQEPDPRLGTKYAHRLSSSSPFSDTFEVPWIKCRHLLDPSSLPHVHPPSFIGSILSSQCPSSVLGFIQIIVTVF